MSESSCCSAETEFAKSLVPADKNLSPEWRASLVERGEPDIYTGDDLKFIGMPVSGICTGQVYLGGDGQLWHWDVFKAYGGSDEEIDPRGHHYANPISPSSPIDQGFGIAITAPDSEVDVRPLNKDGFSEVAFEGKYPMGFVTYRDSDSAASVRLTAYSPFIPLDEDRSGLPAIVMEYEVQNETGSEITAELFGWLENKICRYDDEQGKGTRRNTIELNDSVTLLKATAEASESGDPSSLEGFGDMSVGVISAENAEQVAAAIIEDSASTTAASAYASLQNAAEAASDTRPFGTKTVGAVGQRVTLKPGQKAVVRFVVSWFFPRYSGGYVFHSTMEDLPNLESIRRYYSTMFDSSSAALGYVVENYDDLSQSTRLWTDTWYDSTLPYWLLTRTAANTATMATQTCHRFDDGRFYAWEGVDCCPGTCQHVWQYAQTIARLFPSMERWVREHVDYGIAYRSDGSIEYRAEANSGEINMKTENDAEAFFAADGQLGTILRVYREHTMSADSEFLQRLWPRVKHSLQFMASLDTNEDGLLDAAQFHTLDTSWRGEIPWISSLYLAGLAAGREMATEVGDMEFAAECQELLTVGGKNLVEQLFNGEYFVHKADPENPESMNLTQGCYIDQVFGQGYALQLGLGRVIPEKESKSALESLWQYNYTPDVGMYRENFKEVEGGRWYAMPGEGGLLMCTWPKGDCNRADYEQTLLGLDVTSEGYLNECMTGFEYQVASHMVAEGMTEKGLAIMKTVHDRYHGSKRNPWNEIECSDHYSRAMASYGIFLNVCGHKYHGPNGHIAFDPQVTPEDFRTAFTSAEGWGSFSQEQSNGALTATIDLRYGSLDLRTVGLRVPADDATCTVTLDSKEVACTSRKDDAGLTVIELADPTTISAGSILKIECV